jgi:hypothetical protein
MKGGHYFGRGEKIHIGQPHGEDIGSAITIPFVGSRVMPVNQGIKNESVGHGFISSS